MEGRDVVALRVLCARGGRRGWGRVSVGGARRCVPPRTSKVPRRRRGSGSLRLRGNASAPYGRALHTRRGERRGRRGKKKGSRRRQCPVACCLWFFWKRRGVEARGRAERGCSGLTRVGSADRAAERKEARERERERKRERKIRFLFFAMLKEREVEQRFDSSGQRRRV